MKFLTTNRVCVTLIFISIFSLFAIFDRSVHVLAESDGILGVHNAGPAQILVSVGYSLKNESVTHDVKLKAYNAQKFTIPKEATTNGIKIEEWKLLLTVPTLAEIVIPYRRTVMRKGFMKPQEKCYKTSGANFEVKYSEIPCSDVTD